MGNVKKVDMNGIASLLIAIGFGVAIGYSPLPGEPVLWWVYAACITAVAIGCIMLRLSMSEHTLPQIVYAFFYMLVAVKHIHDTDNRFYQHVRKERKFGAFRYAFAEGLDDFDSRYGIRG